MSDFTVLLADDDPEQLEYMRALVASLRPSWTIAGLFTDIDAVPAAIDEIDPTLCILDVQFSGSTGFEALKDRHAQQPVIYATGNTSHAVEAFDSSAIDFVVKPLGRERFERALRKAEAHVAGTRTKDKRGAPAARRDSSIVRMLRGNDMVVVPLADVRCFEADRKFTRVLLEGQEGYLRMGLSTVETHLNDDTFWRIHRRHVINARHVALAQRDDLGRIHVRLHGRPELLLVSRPFEYHFKDGFS